MKKKQKKNFLKMLLLTIMVIGVILYVYFNSYTSTSLNTLSSSSYSIIKKDNNENYSGIGKKAIEGQDGYSTTFTSFKNKVYKEFKQNGNSSWSTLAYWDGTMADNGCGITAISIILSGYGISFTPEDLRKKYYPVLNGDLISSELSNTFGLSNSGFLYDSEHLSSSYIQNYLSSDRPILICVWDKPTDNRWTTASHYMVLLASDNQGMVYVSNPNGLEDTYKSSGWYTIEEITPYIAKALFIENT